MERKEESKRKKILGALIGDIVGSPYEFYNIKRTDFPLFTDESRFTDEIRPSYCFDVSCQGSCPQAIRAYLEGKDFEDAVRLAVSIGGDSDTIACMAGAIAGAAGQIPLKIAVRAYNLLTPALQEVLDNFEFAV